MDRIYRSGRFLTLGLMLATSVPASAQGALSPIESRILAAHNAARLAAGEAPLAWDAALARGAAAYSMQIAASGIYEHSDKGAPHGVRELIWWGSHGVFSPEQMVGYWVSEKANFAPGVFPNVSRTGNWMDVSHYTQVIWPGTTRVGCGISSARNNDVLVCRYSPAGNIDGQLVLN